MSPAARVPLWARSTISDIQSAPQTFSSWDMCMTKAYCKWPAIIGIIIGTIIVISALACLINCLCCGITCCKACCSCCECCCPSGSGSGHRHDGHGSGGQSKYLDDRTAYQPPSRPANGGYQAPPAPPTYRGPNTAQFDNASHAASKVNEDALPAMPSWDKAITRKVEDPHVHDDDMEMTPLHPPTQSHEILPPAAARRNGPAYAELPSNPPGRHAPHDRYGYDDGFDHNQYGAHSPGPELSHRGGAFDSPMSPYEQSYGGQEQYSDYSHSPGRRQTPGPNMYMPQPQQQQRQQQQQQQQQYHSIPPAPSPHAEMPHQSAFQSQPPQGASPPPSYVSEYHEPAYPTSQPGYHAYTPSHTTSSLPPPFPVAQHDNMEQSSRPPSLLQSGRKPLPNTWR